MANVPDLSQLGRKAPDGETKHAIVFAFVDDHDINGAKIEILNVSPEQIAVAILYLQRFAFMGMAQREGAMMATQEQAESVRVGLARERGTH